MVIGIVFISLLEKYNSFKLFKLNIYVDISYNLLLDIFKYSKLCNDYIYDGILYNKLSFNINSFNSFKYSMVIGILFKLFSDKSNTYTFYNNCKSMLIIYNYYFLQFIFIHYYIYYILLS